MTGYFEDKIALVTGAASGIGKALAEELLSRGAKVVATDRDLSSLQSAFPQTHEKILLEALDVTSVEAFAQVAQTILDKWGRIDLLINNAGVGLTGEMRDVRAKNWQLPMQVNIWGVVHGIDAVYPKMIQQGEGQIINIASGAALAPRPGMAPYAATKAAILALSHSMRPAALAWGVKVNVACPGYIKTNIMKSSEYIGIDSQKLIEKIPLKPISAEDCPKTILDGAAKDQPTMVISKALKLDHFLYRLSPRLSLFIAQWRSKQFRNSRTAEA